MGSRIVMLQQSLTLLGELLECLPIFESPSFFSLILLHDLSLIFVESFIDDIRGCNKVESPNYGSEFFCL